MIRTLFAATLVLAVLAAGAVEAKQNDPEVRLEFVPQQTVGTVTVDLAPLMRDVPVEVRVRDARSGDRSAIGRRTDDDDRVTELVARNAVETFVDQAVGDTLAIWGVATRSGADRTLGIDITRFEVEETNKPVGATYRGMIGLALTLRDSKGRPVWTGTASGETTRYGRKFSGENASEVLSDALLEALGAGLSSSKLHQAWAVEGLPPDSTLSRVPDGPRPSSEQPLSPTALLGEVLRLMEGGLSTATIEAYVGRQALSEELTARDLSAWKDAGISEQVIQAAVRLPVR